MQEIQKKIIVVDDDLNLCLVLRDYLNLQGFEVEFFNSPDEARPALFSKSHDFVLLDWDMPGGTGVELCKEFRDKGGLAPVLILTGRTSLDDKEVGLESGADDYVTKPFHMRELWARIKSMMRRSGAYTAAAQPVAQPSATDQNIEPRPGLLLAGKYKLDVPIGAGGMATVWRATDLTIDRTVVVKLMHDNLAGDENVRRRFEHESKVIAKINHPNVVTIYDVGVLGKGLRYIVMEHIQGVSLRDLIDDAGSMSLHIAVMIMKQVCDGLQEAHNAGIVHRDLKPENILIQDRAIRADSVKIVDFGIARLLNNESKERLTREGMIVGTIEYMSPEQLEDVELDGRSDIYALGIILFELLTGQLPFKATTMEGLIAKHMVAVPPMLSSVCQDVPRGSSLEQIVAICMAKKPEQRYQKASQLKQALEKCI